MLTALALWFNVATYIPEIPAVSFYVESQDLCENLMVFYSKRDHIRFFSCDIEPLPNAIIVKRGDKPIGMGGVNE